MPLTFLRGLPALLIVAALLPSCREARNEARKGEEPFLLHQWNATIKQVMVTDGFTPLLASRTFAYPNIAAYEVLSKGAEGEPSVVSRLNGLTVLPQPANAKPYNFALAAVQAFATVAKKLVYSERACDA